MGADRRLVRWPDMLAWFRSVAVSSDRVRYDTLGHGTEGQPLVLLTISSPENLRQLERFRDIQARLADPRGHDEQQLTADVVACRCIVLVTAAIHATEVGGVQMMPELVYQLATREDPEIRRILSEVILLLVPSLNPDGMELVADWYARTLGTRHEGSAPPRLYHTYAGHDNNRDWFMFTQVETRLLVERVHNIWHPHMVVDLHQLAPNGPRYVLPPFIDPYDPNVDPILQQEAALVGLAMSADLTAQGKPGVATNIIFDAYSPSRAYQHYHGGVRVLCEAAGVHIATPVHIEAGQLREARGFDPRAPSWNHPLPWPGGTWTLGDIVDYHLQATLGALNHAAAYRDRWVGNFLQISRHALASDTPYAFVVPGQQRDPVTTHEMLDVLHTGGVEIERAISSFHLGGEQISAGAYVIKMAQPYGRFAKTLLEVQRYPDLRLYPGGPPQPPYDVTAHSLPLQMGVESRQADQPFNAATEPYIPSLHPAGRLIGTGNHWLLDARINASARALNLLVAQGAIAQRLEAGSDIPDHVAGAFVVGNIAHTTLEEVVHKTGVMLTATAPTDLPGALHPQPPPRIGLYRSWRPNAIDEGWTRFILERYAFSFATLRDADLRHGRLTGQFDVILIPHQPLRDIIEGNAAREYPAKYAGGIGETGLQHLHRFVESGGTLVLLDGATDLALQHIGIPVRNILRDLRSDVFFNPGSLLRLRLDQCHPLAWGFPPEAVILFANSPAFDVRGAALAVGTYPLDGGLLSGWMLGEEHLAGAAALVEAPFGMGRVILFGFRPQFRAQARGTYRLLFNALYRATLEY